MTDILTPHEIVAPLCDSGVIDKGTAHRLEQRIKAWGESQKPAGRQHGILEAARKAKIVVTGIKSPGQRAGAGKVLRAFERLLAANAGCAQEAYARGYQDGAVHERRTIRANQPGKRIIYPWAYPPRRETALRVPLETPWAEPG